MSLHITTCSRKEGSSRSFVRRAFLVVALSVISMSCVQVASAATLSISPSGSGSYTVGQLFSVSVYVSANDGRPMNAISSIVTFPPDLLQLVSSDKTGSIVDFWLGTISTSNSEGKAQFEGGVYNPGYSGGSGKIITFLFKAKAIGTAELAFTSASVLANDGNGTSILDGARGTSIPIRAGQTAPSDGSASMPAITVHSTTHPDQDAWYSTQSVALSWNLPVNTISIRSGYDQSVDGAPKTVSSPPVNETVLALSDGVWYFHLQGKDSTGWGPVSTFKINIDSSAVSPPAFDQFPSILTIGDVLLISGTATANTTVKIFVKDSSGKTSEQVTQAGSDGHFQTVWNSKLSIDSYNVSAEVKNQHGITSARTPDKLVKVQASVLERVAWPFLNYATLFILFVGVLAFIVAWIWYLDHRVSHFKKKVRSQVKKVDQRVHVKFKELEDTVIEQIRLLQREKARRVLTSQEEKIIVALGKHLEDTEKEIEDDVEGIGK